MITVTVNNVYINIVSVHSYSFKQTNIILKVVNKWTDLSKINHKTLNFFVWYKT